MFGGLFGGMGRAVGGIGGAMGLGHPRGNLNQQALEAQLGGGKPVGLGGMMRQFVGGPQMPPQMPAAPLMKPPTPGIPEEGMIQGQLGGADPMLKPQVMTKPVGGAMRGLFGF